jgi:hypothetical protein
MATRSPSQDSNEVFRSSEVRILRAIEGEAQSQRTEDFLVRISPTCNKSPC